MLKVFENLPLTLENEPLDVKLFTSVVSFFVIRGNSYDLKALRANDVQLRARNKTFNYKGMESCK